MTAKILTSDDIVEKIYRSLKERIVSLKAEIHLHGIVANNNLAGVAYQNMKQQKCLENGLQYSKEFLPEDISQKEVIEIIETACANPQYTGVVVQLPLPNNLNPKEILSHLKPNKDPDAFFYILDSKTEPQPPIRPPTPQAMLALLDKTGYRLTDGKLVVVGQGMLVGQPLARMLTELGVHPIIVDKDTPSSHQILKTADVIFTGVGQPGIITPDIIKSGVIIIDAGYANVNRKTMGDADPDCASIASWMTPPIGAVGPLTIATLLANTLKLAETYE